MTISGITTITIIVQGGLKRIGNLDEGAKRFVEGKDWRRKVNESPTSSLPCVLYSGFPSFFYTVYEREKKFLEILARFNCISPCFSPPAFLRESHRSDKWRVKERGEGGGGITSVLRFSTNCAIYLLSSCSCTVSSFFSVYKILFVRVISLFSWFFLFFRFSSS